MKRSNIIARILGITIISAVIALSPVLMFEIGSEAGTTGVGAYIVLFLWTIPIGLAVFIIGTIWAMKSWFRNNT